MNLYESRNQAAKTRTVIGWLGFTLLLAISCYLLVLPLFRPRGDFLWGYYRLKDIYAGIPIGLAFLGVIAVRMSPAKYKRGLALRIMSVFGSVAATILVVDLFYAFVVQGALRPNFWLDQAHIPRIYNTEDSELGFVRKPGVSWRGYIPEANRVVDYRTDENGFRNPSAEHATADAVFIGDSFTEAVEVSENDTFVRRVAAASGLRVVNLGRGGYGPQQQLIVLQRYGLSYKPRIVVWQLFEGNDLMDAHVYASWKNNPHQSDSSLKERYINHSFVTELLTKTRVSDRRVPWITLHYSDATAARIPLNYFYQPPQFEELPVGVAEANSTIREGYFLCQSQGIQLIVVFVPTMIRVMQPYIIFESNEDQIRYLPRAVHDDKSEFSGMMADLCAQIGCTFADSFAALRQAAATDNRHLYIPRDEHLDIRGHEVVAKLVVDWIHNRNIPNRQSGATKLD